MRLTENERAELFLIPFGFKNADLAGAVENLSRGISDLLESGDSRHLQSAIAGAEQLKGICQSIHNLNHTLGMLAAKAFLETELPSLPWGEIEFANNPNSNGPDIYLPEFSIVGELKTTEPSNKTETGTKFGGG